MNPTEVKTEKRCGESLIKGVVLQRIIISLSAEAKDVKRRGKKMTQ